MGRKKIDPVLNSLTYMRVRKGLSISTLSELTGIATTNIHRMEHGQPIGKDDLLSLSTALKCDPRQIMEQRQLVKLPISALIKYKSYVTMLPEDQWSEALRIDGMGEGMHAARVVGDAIRTHHGKGSLLYFHEKPEINPAQLDGEYIVELDKGRHMLCQAAPGSKKGVHTLYPYSSMPPMYEKKVLKAYRILHVIRSQP